MNSLISYIVVAIHARESRSPVKGTTPMMKIKMNVSMDVLRFIPIVLLSRLDRHRVDEAPAGNRANDELGGSSFIH